MVYAPRCSFDLRPVAWAAELWYRPGIVATNGNGDSKKRLEFLEKVFLDDRARWQENDRRWRENDRRWRENDKRLEEMLAELRQQREEFQEDFKDVMRTLVEDRRQIRKLEARQEASLRVLRRLLER